MFETFIDTNGEKINNFNDTIGLSLDFFVRLFGNVRDTFHMRNCFGDIWSCHLIVFELRFICFDTDDAVADFISF